MKLYYYSFSVPSCMYWRTARRRRHWQSNWRHQAQ